MMGMKEDDDLEYWELREETMRDKERFIDSQRAPWDREQSEEEDCSVAYGDAIVVSRDDNGVFSHIGAATREVWRDVVEAADEVVLVDVLTGWGEYTHAYRVAVDGVSLYYFVAAELED